MTAEQCRTLRGYIRGWMRDSKVYWNDLPLEWRKTLASRKWYEDARGSHTYLYAHDIQNHTKGYNIDVPICTSMLIDFKLWMEIMYPHITTDHIGYFPRYMDEARSFS